MPNAPLLKDKICEMIGVFSLSPIPSLLESEFEKLPTAFHSFEDIEQFKTWVEANRPRIVLMDHALLEKVSPESIDSLKKLLQNIESTSLILTQAIKEIHHWRESGWPSLHFYHGVLQAKLLKEKILHLLGERYLLDKPQIVVVSDKPYLLAHLEMNLKNYGIRVLSIHPPHVNDQLTEIASESIDAILWDTAMWDDEKKLLLNRNFNRFVAGELPPLFFVAESWPLSDIPEDSFKEEVYTPIKFKQLMQKIVEALKNKRKIILDAVRDFNTGLYLPDMFIHLAEKMMASSKRTQEAFSILKLQIQNLSQVNDELGVIFAQELETNLGLFIQNRVRASDLVVKSKTGEVLVLLSRVNRELAVLIAEKLQHSFVRAASFNEGAHSSFAPKLVYQIYAYPTDIHQISDIEAILADTKPIQPIKSADSSTECA